MGERARELAWIAVPVAVFFAIVLRLSFNAPVWDDYDAVLSMLLSSLDARGPADWLSILFAQHNEHRIVVGRLATLALHWLTGTIDFRALVLLGDLSLVGALLLMWRQFRGSVRPFAFGVAAIVMLQWSYWEASMMASAALAHLTVIFFAMAAIDFTFRPGAAPAVASVALAIVAAGCQANGLFVLPLCAACAAWVHLRGRAAVHAALAIVVWFLYFRGFVPIPGHLSPLHAFASPIATLELFLVNVGSIVPNLRGAMAAGLFIVAAYGWLAWRRYWNMRPVPMAWAAFLLGTAGAAAMARVGLGVVWQSRYAAVSAALAAILSLCVLARVRATRGRAVFALSAALALFVGASVLAWPDVSARSLTGKLLHEAVPALPQVRVERFAGEYYPDRARADAFLAAAEKAGIYAPPRATILATSVQAGDVPAARPLGHLEDVKVEDRRLAATGWTAIPATVADRSLRVRSPQPFERSDLLVMDRPDVARALADVHALFAGFVLTLEFPTPQAAQEAAKGLCIVAMAPSRAPAAAVGPLSGCPGSR